MNIKCPKCQSEQITSHKKGFGIGKAAVGAVVAGPIGLAAGAIGSSKIQVTCLNCGFKWKAGEQEKEREKIENYNRAVAKVKPISPLTFIITIFLIGLLFIYFTVSLFTNDWGLLGFLCGLISVACFIVSGVIIYEEFILKKQKELSNTTFVIIDELMKDYNQVMSAELKNKLKSEKDRGKKFYEINSLVLSNLQSKKNSSKN